MTFAAHFGVVVRVGLVLAGRQVGKEERHVVVELPLIGLERQQIIGVLVYNELGDGGLAADGIDGDQAAGQSSARSNSGMAVISFDFSATVRWPSTR